MKLMFQFVIIAAIAAVISSCATIGGEPMAQSDATPPPGYNPIYVRQVIQLPANPKDLSVGPTVQISRIDVTDPQTVRLYVHLVDSTGSYLSGGANGKWKSAWCSVQERTENDTSDVDGFTIKEITEANHDSYAIAFVMDHSGSMGNERAVAVQNAAEQFIKMKRPEDGVTLIKYDDKTGVEAPLTTSTYELLSRLRKDGLTGYGGSTAILNGINAGIDQIGSATGYTRKAVLVFTDGMDNSSTILKDTVIKRALATGTMICSVDFGDNITKNFLHDLSSMTGGSYHHMYGTGEFSRVFEDIYKRLRNYYVIEYAPSVYGPHTVSVHVCLPGDTLISENATYDNTPDVGSISLLNVTFDLNKADLKPESKKALRNVAALMKALPKMTIEVRGHTDGQNKTNDPDYNRKLSQRRADAVRDALVKLGVEAVRINTSGFGDTKPIADNATEAGRAKNRRTEFVIVSR